jgi:hypothetical protein
MAKKRVWRHSNDFRRMAVERFDACENIVALAKELGIQLLVDLPWLNGMFEMFHVYPLPVKPNSLQHQACSLLVCSGAAQSYLAAGTYDAMPRQLIYRIGA